MPADLSTVHVDQAMTSLSIEINNADGAYAHAQVFKPFRADDLSGLYFTYGLERFRVSPGPFSDDRALQSALGPGAEAAKINQSVSTKTYQATTYALKDFVSDDEIAIADSPLDPLLDAARFVAHRVRQDLEYVAARVALDYDDYPSGLRTQLTGGGAGTSWNASNYASTSSNPLTNIQTARIAVEAAIGRPANTLALSRTVYRYLQDHPDLGDILKYTDANYLTGEGIPNVLRGLRLVVGLAAVDTAAEGATASLGDLFADVTDSNKGAALVCYVPDGEATIRTVTSFAMIQPANPSTGQRGIAVRAIQRPELHGWDVEALATADFRAGIFSGSSIGGAYLISRAAEA